MKPFRFPLDKALHWRRTQLEVEEFKLKQMTEELRRLGEAQAGIGRARAAAARETFAAPSLVGAHLERLDLFLLRAKREAEALALRRQDLGKRILAQNQSLLEARRRVRLIEKFRDRRLVAWTAELNRETETLASETYLAKWNADKREKGD